MGTQLPLLHPIKGNLQCCNFLLLRTLVGIMLLESSEKQKGVKLTNWLNSEVVEWMCWKVTFLDTLIQYPAQPLDSSRCSATIAMSGQQNSSSKVIKLMNYITYFDRCNVFMHLPSQLAIWCLQLPTHLQSNYTSPLIMKT